MGPLDTFVAISIAPRRLILEPLDWAGSWRKQGVSCVALALTSDFEGDFCLHFTPSM